LDKPDSVQDLVLARLSSLRTMPIESLRTLLPLSSEEIQMDQRRVTCSVWKDDLSDGEVRVVVQVYEQKWFGLWGRMWAEGFRAKSEARTDLIESELWNFR